MTPEEIRARALELKLAFTAQVASAAIQKGLSFQSRVWTDGDLEAFVEYIKSGKKQEEKE